MIGQPEFVINPKARISALSTNENAIDFLHRHPEVIDLDHLVMNENAIHLIKRNLHKLTSYGWNNLCLNKNAIHIIEENLHRIHDVGWINLCLNPNAGSILASHLDKINWQSISSNPGALPILEQNINKIDWLDIVINPNATHIIKKQISENNPETIDNETMYRILCERDPLYYTSICAKTTDDAIEFLENNLSHINWTILSTNEKAYNLLKNNLDKVNWFFMSGNGAMSDILQENIEKVNWNTITQNPGAINLLISLDYNKMKMNNIEFTQELLSYVFSPDRMINISIIYNCPFEKLVNIY